MARYSSPTGGLSFCSEMVLLLRSVNLKRDVVEGYESITWDMGINNVSKYQHRSRE